MKPFHVYLLRCSDASFYVGHTDELEARMQQHFHGDTGYTSIRKPVTLVWQGEFESREGALIFERQIKGWSRAKKEALIAGDWERIQVLAKSRAGLRQAQPERSLAQPERSLAQAERGVAQAERGVAQPERGGSAGLRQAQPERGGSEPAGGAAE